MVGHRQAGQADSGQRKTRVFRAAIKQYNGHPVSGNYRPHRNASRDTGLMLRNWPAAHCADNDVNHAGKDATDVLEIVFNA